MRKKKIQCLVIALFIIDYRFREGASFDLFLWRVILQMLETGNKVVLALPVAPPVMWCNKFKNHGVDWIELTSWRERPADATSKRFPRAALRQLYTAVKLSDFDLIALHHCSHWFSVLLGLKVRISRFKGKIVIHQHNEVVVHVAGIRGFLANKFSKLRLASFFAHAVTTVYQGGAANLIRKGIASKKVAVIPNGLDFPLKVDSEKISDIFTELTIPSTHQLITFIGRLKRDKGVKELLAAFEIIQKKYPKTTLLMVGDGPYESEARHALKLPEPYLIWAGRRSDVFSILKQSTFLVLPSYHESFGLAVAEAGIAGIPVVVSDAGGLPDLVRHERDGFVVPRKDVEALSAAMLKMLDLSPLQRESLGRNFQAHIREDFTMDNMVKNHAVLYRQLVGSITNP